MAIILTPNLTFTRFNNSTNQSLQLPFNIASKTATGSLYLIGEQSFTTSETAVELGDVTAPYTLVFYNPDATNYIILGRTISAAFEGFSRVLPQWPNFLVWHSGTLQAKSSAGTVVLQKFILEA